jgi:hypothetical protein
LPIAIMNESPDGAADGADRLAAERDRADRLATAGDFTRALPLYRALVAAATDDAVLSPAWHRAHACWSAFPSASALGSAGSAVDGSTLFAGFPATMASSDLLRPCIIGFGSSPSRRRPPASSASGQSQDHPFSNAMLLRVTCS